MAEKPKLKRKLSDEDRHKRFKDMAREVEASESPKDFDEVFVRITSQSPKR